MSEIEKIYQCVFDKAYLNKVELCRRIWCINNRRYKR